MRAWNQFAAGLALVLIATLAWGCGGGDSATFDNGDDTGRLRIAVIPKGTSHDFWNSVKAGADKAAKELEVDINWTGPPSESDIDRQIDIVENCMLGGYDGICLAPSDAHSLRRPVQQSIDQGIPVLIFDSALEDQDGIVSYVATNNYRGGQRAGEHLAELLKGQGEVILMRYEIGSESTEQREQGFLDAIAKHEGIQLLVSDQYAGADETKALELGERLLEKYGDRVQGIFCPNQSTTGGMLTALQRDSRQLAGKVKFVGFDSGAKIAQGLEAGDLHATVLQDPVTMGYEAVRVMVDQLQGKKVEQRVETREILATHDNLDDPDVHALLYPTGQQ
jgi:ribose transport system substrate-binding protein